MTSRIQLLIPLLLAACSSSHAPGSDAGSDSGLCGDCPTFCCAEEFGGGYYCDGVGGRTCEGGGTGSCQDVCPPTPAGCVLTSYFPNCFSCTLDCGDAGTDAAVDAGAATCEGLTESRCWADADCAAEYDDDCCPLCRPIGACADCVDPVFFACLPAADACSPAVDLCGSVPSCGGPLDCSAAVANVALGSCSIPGCVPAVDASCFGDCRAECHAVTGDICDASCDIPEPRCGFDGWVAEVAGGCYTGLCIPGEVCGRGLAGTP